MVGNCQVFVSHKDFLMHINKLVFCVRLQNRTAQINVSLSALWFSLSQIFCVCLKLLGLVMSA